MELFAWFRLRNDLGVRQRKCNLNTEKRQGFQKSSTFQRIGGPTTKSPEQIIEIPGQACGRKKVSTNLSSILRSAKTLDSQFSPLTMSDSASHDDKTSLRSTNQAEKMEKKEAAASGAVPTAAAVPYPSNQKRILIMTALYLAAFLVTLVRPAPFPGSNSLPCRLGCLLEL